MDVNGSVHRGFSFPPAYDGRVEKKGQATLVVKNVQFEDSTKYVCFLDGKAPTPDAESTVNLIVTGKLFPLLGDVIFIVHYKNDGQGESNKSKSF